MLHDPVTSVRRTPLALVAALALAGLAGCGGSGEGTTPNEEAAPGEPPIGQAVASPAPGGEPAPIVVTSMETGTPPIAVATPDTEEAPMTPPATPPRPGPVPVDTPTSPIPSPAEPDVVRVPAPVPAPDVEPKPEPGTGTGTVTQVRCGPIDDAGRDYLLGLVNDARAEARSCGAQAFPPAPTLVWNTDLESAAAGHSDDMATRNFFDHTGSDGTGLGARVTRTGFAWSRVGENIAAGQSTARGAVDGWIASPGHCRNLMDPDFSSLGMACTADAGTD